MGKIEKWYRGHSRQRHALDSFGIIWLTDDPYYAQVYAEDDGVVSVVYIDESKVNDAPIWEDIDFDQYFPDEESIEEYKQEGYNGYYFMASYDYEDFQCLALFDKSPVVRVEEYKDEIEENMKLNYNDIRYIINESTKRIINEVYGDKWERSGYVPRDGMTGGAWGSSSVTGIYRINIQELVEMIDEETYSDELYEKLLSIEDDLYFNVKGTYGFDDTVGMPEGFYDIKVDITPAIEAITNVSLFRGDEIHELKNAIRYIADDVETEDGEGVEWK